MSRFGTLGIVVLALVTIPPAHAQIPYDFGRCEPARIRRTVERLNERAMFARNFKNVERTEVYEYLSDRFNLTIVIHAKDLNKPGELPFVDQKITFGAADV